MNIDIIHTPAKITVFREFGASPGEISLTVANQEKSLVYLPRSLVVRNQAYVPVTIAHLVKTDATNQGADPTPDGPYALKPGVTAHFDLRLTVEALSQVSLDSEYTFCLQVESSPLFTWTDQILQNIGLFQTWQREGVESPELTAAYGRILRASFEHIHNIAFNVRELTQARETLCLDFGTSYSVCACFVTSQIAQELSSVTRLAANQINHCQFRTPEGEVKKLEPTKMLLKRYDPHTGEIDWAFGYEAEQLAAKNPAGATYLTGIKAMLGEMELRRTCRDLSANVVTLKYRDILTAYLRHLTDTSRKYFGIHFRSIHVSTPVLYTERQRNAYDQILRELGFTDIIARLDEAKSPLYHFLSEYLRIYQQDSQARPDPETISYFVIDCGGGSTDAMHFEQITLAHADDGTKAVKLEFSSPKVVGNPFFGGQRLTLLLFKYLKMRLCKAMQEDTGTGGFLIDQLLDYQETDVFYQLNEQEEALKLQKRTDEIAREQMQMYQTFEARYREQEQHLPTHFSRYQSQDARTHAQVEYNYNLLWLLAEQVKTRIYADDAPRTIRLDDLPEWNDNQGFWLDGKLNKEARLATIAIERYELNKLYRPIIFIEISRLFRNLNLTSETFVSDSRNKRPYARFVGQTTRIPLFDEALGYHIPRKVIEKSKKDKDDQRFRDLNAETKKLCTASGVAQYLRHVKKGMVVEDNFSQNEILLFDICLFDQDEQDEHGEYRIQQQLIQRDCCVSEAEAWYLRTQASASEDFIGYKYEEHKMPLGTVEFDRSQMTRCLQDAEATRLHERSAEKSLRLKDDQNMLICLSIKQVDYAQKLVFQPYISKQGVYYTSPAPVEINFQSDHISLNAVNDYLVNGV